MLTVRVGGVWLRSLKDSYDELTMVHTWPRGSDELSWRMRPGASHPKLSTGGAFTECFNGGLRVWRGFLSQPAADGQFFAKGSWSEASGVYAIDGSGNATNTVDTAIDAAIARGAVTWTRPASLSSVSWGTVGEPMRLLDLLDQAMAGLGKRWYVDPDGAVRAAVDPATPSFHVPEAVAGHGLTLAEDDYFSHLVGKYLAAGPVFATATVGDAAAAAKWGRKEELVDLTNMGVISGAAATAQLTALLGLVGARLGFAESLELGYNEITTPGGTPVALSMPLACTRTGGQAVRLQGVADRTRVVADRPVTDIVIGRSVYTDGGATVQLTPLGKASRDLRELLGGR